MFKILIIYSLLAITFFAPIFAVGQKVEPGSAIIKIKVATGYDNPDSILVSAFEGIVGLNYKMQTYRLKENGNQLETKVRLDQEITPLVIYTYHPGWGNASTTYYIEKGDNLNLVVYPDKNDKISMKVDFQGNGASKNLLIAKMNQAKIQMYDKQNDDLKVLFGNEINGVAGNLDSIYTHNPAIFLRNLKLLLGNIKKGLSEEDQILHSFKGKIKNPILEMLSIELDNYHCFLWTINNLFSFSKNDAVKKALSDFYFTNINSIRPSTEISLIKYAFGFKHLKSMEIQTEMFIASGGQKYPFNTLYDNTKREINPELREILLTSLFVRDLYSFYADKMETKDSLLNEAILIVSQPELLDALKTHKVYRKGSPLFNFSFADTTGKITTLNDLKGKVFMIDLSGTGCAPCAQFAKRFRDEIYPEFEDNPSFKVISLNIDNTRARWIAAIKSGLYTQRGAIELSIGRLQFNDPFLKYYKVKAVPFILLVDKNGKLIEKLNEASDSRKISKLIKEALAQR